MHDKVVNTCGFVFYSVVFYPDGYITQKMYDKFVIKEPFLLKCCSDRYKIQEVCDKAVDAYLLTLKFVPDWFDTKKMLEKLDNSAFSNGDRFFHDVDSSFITFLSDDMGFNTIDLNSINLDDGDNNFDEEYPETIILVRLMA